MRITIGCPVRDRAWIMPQWFRHTTQAAATAEVEVDYLFVGAKGDPTFDVVHTTCPDDYRIVDSGEQVEPDRHQHGRRGWNPAEFRRMVLLRNMLILAAREGSADYFLSLDSDILLHPQALANMVETIQQGWDAVGGKCWMTELRDACSYGYLINSNGMLRPDVSEVLPVDLIMAIKLMGPKALALDYCWDRDGEDVGWSRAAGRAGVKLAFDGRVCSKHVLWPRNLDQIDVRCGF